MLEAELIRFKGFQTCASCGAAGAGGGRVAIIVACRVIRITVINSKLRLPDVYGFLHESRCAMVHASSMVESTADGHLTVEGDANVCAGAKQDGLRCEPGGHGRTGS